VLAAFSTTLMSVGVLTYPLERQYFGVKVTLVRNAISFLIALIVAVVIGLVFGEIRL
jgi:ABC-type nitrate/sulfonate/bicarbonate transport system permease component